MITYNTKDWFTFIFRIHKSDTLKKLFYTLIGIAIYSFLVSYIVDYAIPKSIQETLKDLTLIHSLLAFVLSLLLVFRTNSAYDRWWEGRKAWGSLVNTSRNLALKLSAFLPDNDSKSWKFYTKIIPLYATSLTAHLRKVQVTLDIDNTISSEFGTIEPEKHVPNQIARLIFQKTNQLYKEGKIDSFQFINLQENINELTNICGVCERIKSTPIPFSYNVFIKKFIFIYVMTLPWSFTYSLHFTVIYLTTFVFYVLASIEIIAEEIEDPFGNDPNDLPIDKIAENIKKHVHEILT